MKVKVSVAQSCLILYDPMDCSLPGSSVYGILQARTLEWVVIPFSRVSSQPRDQTQVSRIAGRFFTTVPPGKSPGCRHLNKTKDICKDFISKQGHIQRLWVDMTLKVKLLVTQSCLTLCNRMVYPWNSLGKNTGVGCHSLLQGIFPTEGMNQGFLHCRQIFFTI